MNKAILIIDMPNNCYDCPCCYDHKCCKAQYGIEVLDDEIPKGCPLKRIPEKQEKLKGRGKDHCEYSLLEQLEYRKGWNDCLEEILGEDNNDNN